MTRRLHVLLQDYEEVLFNESYLEYFSFIRYLNVAKNIVDGNQ